MSPITSADKNNIYGIKTILISLKVNCYDFDGKLNKNNHNQLHILQVRVLASIVLDV